MKALEINNKSVKAYEGIVAICLIYILEIQRRIQDFKLREDNEKENQLIEM